MTLGSTGAYPSTVGEKVQNVYVGYLRSGGRAPPDFRDRQASLTCTGRMPFTTKGEVSHVQRKVEEPRAQPSQGPGS